MTVKQKLELLGNGFLIIFGAISLYTFSSIWLYGEVVFIERALPWLILTCIILAVGMERLIDDLYRDDAGVLEYIGDGLVITFGTWTLVKTLHFWMYEMAIFIEPNLIILTIETLVSIGIVGIGIERTADDIIRLGKGDR